MILYNPGERIPISGQYEIVGPRGGKLDGLQVTCIEGKKFPPTQIAGNKYKLVDTTRHRNR